MFEITLLRSPHSDFLKVWLGPCRSTPRGTGPLHYTGTEQAGKWRDLFGVGTQFILLSSFSGFFPLWSPLQPLWGLLFLPAKGERMLAHLWARMCSPVPLPSVWHMQHFHSRCKGLKLLSQWSASEKVLNQSMFSLIVLCSLINFIN